MPGQQVRLAEDVVAGIDDIRAAAGPLARSRSDAAGRTSARTRPGPCYRIRGRCGARTDRSEDREVEDDPEAQGTREAQGRHRDGHAWPFVTSTLPGRVEPRPGRSYGGGGGERNNMMRCLTVVVLVLMVFLSAPVSAQSIRESAHRWVETAQPAETQARRRSWVRTWSGVGIAWAGAVVAASSLRCEVSGNYQNTYERLYDSDLGWGDYTFSGSNPDLNETTCEVEDFTLSVYGSGRGFSISGSGPASEVTSSFRYLVDDVSENVEAVRVPTAGMYAGLGMVAVGALLATIWSDVPATENLSVTPLPGGALVGASFGF